MLTDELAAHLAPHVGPRMLCAMVEALEVRRRYQFFLWTQGHLQALLPHGLLVCGTPGEGGNVLAFDCFYNLPVAPETLARLCHPYEGMAAAMAELWQRRGCEPLLLDDDERDASRELRARFKAAGLGEPIAHGIPGLQLNALPQCFFAFVSTTRVPAECDRALLAMLVPTVFGAYSRALILEQTEASARRMQQPEVGLTHREVEILRWVRDGKSNHEIALILGISPLTVKNHVQKILRKLHASNRAQAVSRAIALKLLGAQRTPTGSDLTSFA